MNKRQRKKDKKKQERRTEEFLKTYIVLWGDSAPPQPMYFSKINDPYMVWGAICTVKAYS